MKHSPCLARRLFAVAIFAIVALPAFAQAASAANNPSVKVSMFAFSPGTITVPAGTRVTWTNRDEEPHTVFGLSGGFRSDALDTGQSFSFVFATPGTYKYICSIHPHMKGVVIVTPRG